MVHDVPTRIVFACPYCRADITSPAVYEGLRAHEGESSGPATIPAGAAPALAAQGGTSLNPFEFLQDSRAPSRGYQLNDNPWVAAGLSLFTCLCFGQFYNGDWFWGSVILSGFIAVQCALLLLGTTCAWPGLAACYGLMGATVVLVAVGTAAHAFVTARRAAAKNRPGKSAGQARCLQSQPLELQ
jgi:hypothetical protein